MTSPERPEARLFEETLRPIFARALGSGTALKLSHENVTGDPRQLPMVGIAVRNTGDNYEIRDSEGKPSQNLELTLECRVAEGLPESARTIETLAGSVKAALLTATEDDFTLWEIVDALEFTGSEPSSDNGARVITHTATLVVQLALPTFDSESVTFDSETVTFDAA